MTNEKKYDTPSVTELVRDIPAGSTVTFIGDNPDHPFCLKIVVPPAATNESTEPAWSGYEQEIPAHNGSVDGSNPSGDTKYKRVNLDELYVTIYFPDGRKDSVETDAYNRAIDDIKSKYGDLWVGVK